MPLAAPPLAVRNFLVDIGDGDARASGRGFAEVVFPEFTASEERGAGLAEPLLLRRAATGKLDLYEWWDKARGAPDAGVRTVTVELLGDDFDTVLLRWRFVGARPLSLAYTPLDANGDGLLFETLTLAFERLEMG